MAGGGSDREQNYWPGFVDALSNVVLTLVFVLVVFVFALVITSGKVKQKSAQMAEQKVEQEKTSAKRVKDLESEVKVISTAHAQLIAELAAARLSREKMLEELKELEASNAALRTYKASVEEKEHNTTPSIILNKVNLVADTAPKKPAGETEAAETESSNNAIVITYPRAVTALNDAAKANLAKALEPYRGKLGGTKATLDAYLGAETYSEGRRSAYYRALDLRNFLLERKLISPEAVVISTKPNKDAADGRIELRFVRP